MRWLVALLFVGCATVLPAGQSEPPCRPDGLPEVQTWRALQSEPAVLQDASGRPILTVLVYYDVNQVPVRGWWLGRDLIAVDPDASDLKRPMLVDQGIVGPEGKLKVDGAPSCRWGPSSTSAWLKSDHTAGA